MTDARTVHVRDIALGVLVMVLGLFFYYFSWWMTSFIPVLDFIAAIVFLWMGKMLLVTGYTFIVGVDVDLP